MGKIKVLFIAGALVAGALIILLQREQNRQLVQEIALVRETNSRLESTQPTVTSDQGTNQNRETEDLQSEVTRLRAVATKASRTEAEVAQLKAELERLRAQKPGEAAGAATGGDALSAYLGNPVEMPATMDPAYSKEGLLSAVQTAAQKAGIALKKVGTDESEFPVLLGVQCEPGDWEKLKNQLRTMDGYEFNGSVGDDTRNTFSLVPSRAFPGPNNAQINRRMNTRLELFYDNFRAQGN